MSITEFFSNIKDMFITLYNKMICSFTNHPDCHEDKINRKTIKPLSLRKKSDTNDQDIKVVQVKIKKVVVKKHKNEN